MNETITHRSREQLAAPWRVVGRGSAPVQPRVGVRAARDLEGPL